MQTCQNCRFIHLLAGSPPQCRRYPKPMFIAPEDWCGEWDGVVEKTVEPEAQIAGMQVQFVEPESYKYPKGKRR
jgi:hypothetical protein